MRTLTPGQASPSLPSLPFLLDLIDQFHHMQLNLMQEHEIAYGFHPRKIINPQVISVKWQEKKIYWSWFWKGQERRKQGNDVTSGGFLNFEP